MKRVLTLLIVLLLLINSSCIRVEDSNSTRCIEEERQALLTLKNSFKGPYVQRLGSWRVRDCCSWEGVRCDESTGHVLKLDMRAPFKISNIESEDIPEYEWESLEAREVNPSLMKLKYLKYLDLSGNDFQWSSIPMFLGQMKGMTYLNLSYAYFYNTVPRRLGNLSNLKFLDLGLMYEARSVSERGSLSVDDFSWVSTLSSLQYLDMGGVDFSEVARNLMHQVLGHLPSLLHLCLSSCGLTNTHLFTTSTDPPYINSTFLPPTLRYLDLSHNSFYGPIHVCLQNITSLEVFHFHDNLLNSSIPLWLGNFKNLESLRFDHNELDSPDGEIWLILRNLSSLHLLDLSINQFSGIIPASIGSLTSLSSLDLSGNQFTGVIPISLWRLSSLTKLGLSFNKLNGTISTSLGRLSNLITLDLSYNQLGGVVPESLGQLVNLRWLCLESNVLEGVVSSEYHLANLSSLRSLEMGNNHLIKLRIEPNWTPPFQLGSIQLRSCKFQPGQFPAWLRTQNKLGTLDLSNTSISDTFPLWLLEDKPFLYFLDISHNLIKGPLPPYLEKEFPFYVIITDNMLNGSIPDWFCNVQSGLTLDLSKNRFSGHIPNCWNNLQRFEVINLSSNNLSGIIPSSFQNMSSLQWLLLGDNNLIGPIPLGLSNLSLSVLDLGDNRLSGYIPIWIGDRFPSLQILNLRNNMFIGIIPPQLCLLSFLRIIDLSDNDLEGNLPFCLGHLTTMTILQSLPATKHSGAWSTSNIRQVLKGREMEYTTVLIYVVNMDLSGNRLVGSIPKELTQLLGLVGLNLARNQLTGSIPKNIGDLRSLQSLDLSDNQLSGEIPNTISSLTFLSYLNLSNNNLVGKIPQDNQLLTFNDPSIYEDNPHLCGPPLLQACPKYNPTTNVYGGDGSIEDKEMDSEKIWFYVVVMAGYAIGFWAVVGVLLVKKSWRHAYFTYVDEIKDKVYMVVEVKMGALKKMMKKTKNYQPQ